MIKRFDDISGIYIEKIEGQERLAFSTSDTVDFYDLTELAEDVGYKGAVIKFYDFSNGKVYTPFERKRNTVYGNPVYSDGFCYFLRADYDEQVVQLIKYYPEQKPEVVKEFSINDVDLYNLMLLGKEIHVVSQDSDFKCYYPSEFSFSLKNNERVVLISGDTVYCEEWTEEGWNDEKDCRTEDYSCYDKINIRDLSGNLLSEEKGTIVRSSDGSWWIA